MTAVPSGDPKHPLPFPFRELSDDEFDELVYLVAHDADAEVVKTRAPDGGLDTVRLAKDDPLRATWGIQANLHREQIKWPNCKESLDRAVEQWNAPHVTFAFPRDLTHGQHKNFVKHLVGRHAGSQYTSYAFNEVLDDHQVLASIGTVGDALDNALAESFVDTFKTELICDRV